MYYAGLSAVLGLILNRMNVAITGMAGQLGDYFPSWEELSITVMLVSLGFAAFAWAVRNLPVFGHTPMPAVVYVNPLETGEPKEPAAKLQTA
jgi:Ni/Fe-hydrogenase subunit HybB-like protein